MARKKLTDAQKKKNKAMYKQIKKGYEKTGGKTSSGNKISYIQFKHRVEARMSSGKLNVSQAIRKELNTESFKSAAERSRTNLLSAIKEEYRDVYDQIKNISRDENGRFSSISSNLTWNSSRGGYTIQYKGTTYFIDVTNSPKEVSMYAI